uniref:Uncharacterized protein n=1 Tax=Oryza sativa subsp. japonica TaxID=39947 RepID=Q109R9_ORYSJ|nr:hypothetical protein LOC_Os10g23004 [Oryza sativa Japonica Group]
MATLGQRAKEAVGGAWGCLDPVVPSHLKTGYSAQEFGAAERRQAVTLGWRAKEAAAGAWGVQIRWCRGDASENNTNSPEELQIQDELEADIEEDLEREIIDDMCRLTRHLQRLYQQRDLRQLTGSATSYQMPLYHTTTEVLSEINIRINLDGQCNINITKIEQDDDTENQRKTCPNAYQSDKRQGHVKARQTYTVSRRKQQNHPVAPWR